MAGQRREREDHDALAAPALQLDADCGEPGQEAAAVTAALRVLLDGAGRVVGAGGRHRSITA